MKLSKEKLFIVFFVFLISCNRENHFFLNFQAAQDISTFLTEDFTKKFQGKKPEEIKKLLQPIAKKYLAISEKMINSKNDNAVLNFNHSLIFSMNEKPKQALEAFNKASMLTSVIDSSDLFYNLGNYYYLINKGKESVQAYIEALKLNPEHYNAKYNLQFALQKKKQQKKQQDKKDKNKKKQQDKKDKKNQDKQKKKDPKNKKTNNKKDQNKKKKQQKGKSMTKEQAIRLLNALRGQEKKKLLKSIKRKNGNKGKAIPKNGKDW